MLNYILSILLFTASPTLQNNSFEGSIDLIYISQYDTTYFSYFVKHDNVRVDKFDKNHKKILFMLLVHHGNYIHRLFILPVIIQKIRVSRC